MWTFSATKLFYMQVKVRVLVCRVEKNELENVFSIKPKVENDAKKSAMKWEFIL